MEKPNTTPFKAGLVKWDEESLRKFYRAFHKLGVDSWSKVSKAVGGQKTAEHCEALYKQNQMFLSLPSSEQLETAFVAMHIDHSNNLKEADCTQSGSEGKSVQPNVEDKPVDGPEPSSQRAKRTPKPKTLSDEETKVQPSPSRRPGAGTPGARAKALNGDGGGATQPKKRSRKLFTGDGGAEDADFRSPLLERWHEQHQDDVGEGVDALLSLASIAHASSAGLAGNGDDSDVLGGDMLEGVGDAAHQHLHGQASFGGGVGRERASASAAKKGSSKQAGGAGGGSNGHRVSSSPAGTPSKATAATKGGKSAQLKSPSKAAQGMRSPTHKSAAAPVVSAAAGLALAAQQHQQVPDLTTQEVLGPSSSLQDPVRTQQQQAQGSAPAPGDPAAAGRVGQRSKRRAANPEVVAATIAAGGASNAALMRNSSTSNSQANGSSAGGASGALPMAVSSIRTRNTGGINAPRSQLGKRTSAGSGAPPVKRQASQGSQQQQSSAAAGGLEESDTLAATGQMGYPPYYDPHAPAGSQQLPPWGIAPSLPGGAASAYRMGPAGLLSGRTSSGQPAAAAAAAPPGRLRRRKPAPERMPPMMTPIKLLVARSAAATPGGMVGLGGVAAPMMGENGEPMPTIEQALRRCLSPRMRRWAMFEFHCSALDRPWLLRNELMDFARSLGLGNVGLSRYEWSVLRSSLGKPRRLSVAFLREERIRLEAYREHVRRQYDEVGVGMEVPPELPRPLRVGQAVTARHPVTRQLHDGTILTAKGSKYRVQFNRSELMTEVVRDTDVMPVDPNECLPLTMLVHPPPVLNGRPHQGPAAAKTRGVLVPRRGPSAGRALQEAQAQDLLVRDTDLTMMDDAARYLELKQSLVQRLKELNEQASKASGGQAGAGGGAGSSAGDASGSIVQSEAFQMQYTSVVLQLKDANDKLELALSRLQSRGQQVQQAMATNAAKNMAVIAAAAAAAGTDGMPFTTATPAMSAGPGPGAPSSGGCSSASGSGGGAPPATSSLAVKQELPAPAPLPLQHQSSLPSEPSAANTSSAPAPPPAAMHKAPAGTAALDDAGLMAQASLAEARQLVSSVKQRQQVKAEEGGSTAEQQQQQQGDEHINTMVAACASVLLTVQKVTAPGAAAAAVHQAAAAAAAAAAAGSAGAPGLSASLVCRALDAALEAVPQPCSEANSQLYRQVMDVAQSLKAKLTAAC